MKKLLLLGAVAAALAAGSFVYLNHEKQDDPVNNVNRQTGVWYPPYASREEYDARKANYAADVGRAFHENPQLATSVCYELRHSLVSSDSLPPDAKQLRAFLTANCMSLPHEQQVAAAKVAKAHAVAKSLDDLMKEALAAADAVPPEQRHAAENALVNDPDQYDDVNDAFSAGARAIALRPQDARGTYLLLAASAYPWNYSSIKQPEVRTFLDAFYRDRIAGAGPDAWKWQYGYRDFLLFTGRFDEATALTAKLPLGGDLNVQFETAERALIARLNGKRDALATLHDRDGWLAVIDTAFSILRIQKEKAPPAVKETLIEAMRANPDDWPARMSTIREIRKVDQPLAVAEYQRVLRQDRADAPEGAVIDTVYGLAQIADDSGDKSKSIALTDCWLSLNGVTVTTAVTPKIWDALGKLPNTAAEGKKQDDAPCFAGTLRDPQRAGDCATHALLRRLTAAIEAKDLATAKQTVEQLTAYALQNGLTADSPRTALVQLASTERQLGMTSEAQQVATYLSTHPHGAYVEQAITGIPLAPAAPEPWHSPTATKGGRAGECPPR